jgi:hypothetical protein
MAKRKRPARKPVGKTEGRVALNLTPSVDTTVADVERILGIFGEVTKHPFYWILKPEFIRGASRDTVQAKIRGMRIKLVHTKWQDCREAAAELSDIGGVLRVQIFRIRMSMADNSTWVDGKQL